MRVPLSRYVATCSVFQITILCQSVMSFHSPDCWSLVRRFVARENLEIEIPLGVNLVSASLPRCPIRMTLLTLFDAILPCTVTHPAASVLASSLGKKGETARRSEEHTSELQSLRH